MNVIQQLSIGQVIFYRIQFLFLKLLLLLVFEGCNELSEKIRKAFIQQRRTCASEQMIGKIKVSLPKLTDRLNAKSFIGRAIIPALFFDKRTIAGRFIKLFKSAYLNEKKAASIGLAI
jgi:hypothetical protein